MVKTEVQSHGDGGALDVTLTEGSPTENAILRVESGIVAPERKLAESMHGHAVSGSITGALALETIPQFTLGILPTTDETYTGTARDARMRVAAAFNELLREPVEDGQFKLSLPTTPKEYVKVRRGPRIKAAPATFNVLWGNHEGDNQPLLDGGSWRPMGGLVSTDELHKRGLQGLAGCEGVGPLLTNLQLLYAKESPPVWDDETLALSIEPVLQDKKDLESIFGGHIPEDLTFEDLASVIRTVGEPDLSQEALATRFNTFTGLLNLDLSVAILRELALYSTFGNNKARQAVALAREYQTDLLSDNLRRKQEILSGIAAMCTEAIPQFDKGKGPKTARIGAQSALRAMSAYACSLEASTNEFLQFFSNVYEELGYDLPEQLQPETEPVVDAEATLTQVAGNLAVTQVAKCTTVGVEQEVPSEVIAEIGGLRQALEARTDEVMRSWKLSNKEITDLGLDPLVNTLKPGVQLDPTLEGMGEWALAPMTSDYVKTLLGGLVRLDATYRSSGGREAVLHQLQIAAEERQELLDVAMILQAYAEERGYADRFSVPRPMDISEPLQYVADNWHIFHRLFKEAGLEEVRPEFIGNVWQILPDAKRNSAYNRLRDEYEHRYDLRRVAGSDIKS